MPPDTFSSGLQLMDDITETHFLPADRAIFRLRMKVASLATAYAHLYMVEHALMVSLLWKIPDELIDELLEYE